MSIPHRCSNYKCRKRKSFSDKQMRTLKTMKSFTCECGGTFVIDTYRNSGKEFKDSLCRCAAYPYPHKSTSSKFCYLNKYDPSEQELRDHLNSFFLKANLN